MVVGQSTAETVIDCKLHKTWSGFDDDRVFISQRNQ